MAIQGLTHAAYGSWIATSLTLLAMTIAFKRDVAQARPGALLHSLAAGLEIGDDQGPQSHADDRRASTPHARTGRDGRNALYQPVVPPRRLIGRSGKGGLRLGSQMRWSRPISIDNAAEIAACALMMTTPLSSGLYYAPLS